MKNLLMSFLAVTLLALAGCAGLNYSQATPEAANFHPKTVAVLPVIVGDHESSRQVIGPVVSQVLVETGWFTSVIGSDDVVGLASSNPELSSLIEAYIQKLNTIGVSDPQMVAKLNDTLHSEAIVLVNVTSWGHGRMEGNKVARAGLGIKLVDASKGQIVWRASHEIVEKYTVMKPDLTDIATEVLAILTDEMPH